MPYMPILQEIHAELSLWQKVKLLAKVYMRQFYGALVIGFQTTLDLVGVISTLGYYNPFKTTSPGEIMAEELGQKIIELEPSASVELGKSSLITGFHNHDVWYQIYLGHDGFLDFYIDEKEVEVSSRTHALAFFGNCGFRYAENMVKFYENSKMMPYQKSAPNPVPPGSYYVDLRWDTVANSEVNYKDFWK